MRNDKFIKKEAIKAWMVENNRMQPNWLYWQFQKDYDRVRKWLFSDGNDISQSILDHFYLLMNPAKVNLFVYQTEEIGCKIISEWMMKSTDPKNTNDPFEYMPSEENVKFYPGFSPRILCFSRMISSAALWGHYAGRHTGMCLVYTFPIYPCYSSETLQHWRLADIEEKEIFHQCLYPVQYSKKRVPLVINNKGYCTSMKLENAEEIFNTKDKSWSFEQEYRIICHEILADCKNSKNDCFYRFPMSYLSGVVLGVNCSKTEEEMRYLYDMLSQKYPNRNMPPIRIARGRFSKSNFKIENDFWNDTHISDLPKPYRSDPFTDSCSDWGKPDFYIRWTAIADPIGLSPNLTYEIHSENSGSPSK